MTVWVCDDGRWVEMEDGHRFEGMVGGDGGIYQCLEADEGVYEIYRRRSSVAGGSGDLPLFLVAVELPVAAGDVVAASSLPELLQVRAWLAEDRRQFFECRYGSARECVNRG